MYVDTKIKSHLWERKFSDVNSYTEYDWHQDEFTRKVTVIESGEWYFQLDNQVPEKCKPGSVFHIEKYVWHRIIGKSGKLSVLIQEKI